ncbi:MAG: hypothetical protein WC248_05425 [Candidatus Methanomethylophilaceae archaeon]|jgi:hypothetical protein
MYRLRNVQEAGFMTDLIIMALTASFMGFEYIACIPKKVEVPYAVIVTLLTQKRIMAKTSRGTFRIVEETLHPA